MRSARTGGDPSPTAGSTAMSWPAPGMAGPSMSGPAGPIIRADTALPPTRCRCGAATSTSAGSNHDSEPVGPGVCACPGDLHLGHRGVPAGASGQCLAAPGRPGARRRLRRGPRGRLCRRLHALTQTEGLHAHVLFTDLAIYMEKGERIDYFAAGELAAL